MKIAVHYTIEVTDEFRRALRFRDGKEGLATREEIQEHYMQHGGTLDDDIMSEWEDAQGEKATTEETEDGTPETS